MDVRSNIKTYFDMAYAGEAVFVPRKGNKNVYIISQKEYEEFQKAKRNDEYLSMLNRSINQLNNGDVSVKSLSELRAME